MRFGIVVVAVLLLVPFAASAQQSPPAPPAAAPQTEDAILQSAVEALRENRYDDSLALCAKAVEANPKDFRPPLLTGFVYMAQKKYRSASDAFGTAISLEPRKKELYLLKAKVDSGRDAKDEAVADCRKALEVDPSYAEANAMIGDVLRWNRERRPEAIAAYRAAVATNPRLVAVYEPLGSLLDESGDPKAAESVFRSGLEADATHMACRFTFGRMLVRQGRLAEARELWNGRSSDEDHTFPNFVDVLERAERKKKAIDELAQHPSDPEALVAMGTAEMDGDSWVVDGRQTRAIEYFEKALKARPGFAPAQYGICKAWIEVAAFDAKKATVVDAELAKLRLLDPKLADELGDFRKQYRGGLQGEPVDPAALDH